jgi:UDP-glucuronate 4-epimerase
MSAPTGPVLVTGAAGFIGFHTAAKLLDEGHEVVGVDNLNDYYDPALKRARLERLLGRPGFTFAELDVANTEGLREVFVRSTPKRVIHLAAQAGVRYSLINPHAFAQSNLVGFTNILECCRGFEVAHLVYASTSSVYGANTRLPFSVSQTTDHPLSLYAATKKANEVMAHSYSHLFNLPTTGLRFFTVYGPWGRPDMMMFLFTKAILENRPIELFNGGEMRRDFTYVDDIVDGVLRAAESLPVGAAGWSGAAPTLGESSAPYRLFNIGNNSSVPLMYVVGLLERALGREAQKIMRPMQAGDVPETYADLANFTAVTGFRPKTSIEEGVARFVAWYRDFYRV